MRLFAEFDNEFQDDFALQMPPFDPLTMGPYCTCAGAVYCPGQNAGEVFNIGGQSRIDTTDPDGVILLGVVYMPGQSFGQVVECEECP